jgi:hypothetical protein
MMHSSKTRVSIFSAAVLVGLASLFARTAGAAPDYPPRLQAALETLFGKSLCVPQCTACHLTNLGGPGMLNVFGQNLETYGLLRGIPDDPNFEKEIAAYFDAVAAGKTNGDSDGDGTSDKDEILAGDSPAIALPRGKSLFCPDIEYGCAGSRIASAPPPVGHIGVWSAGLAVVGFAAIRRRRRQRRRS